MALEMNRKLKDSMINVYDLQKKISVLSPVAAPQPALDLNFTPSKQTQNVNVSALLKEANENKDLKSSPAKEGKLSSRHRLSQTSLLPSIKKTLTAEDEEDEYYDEEYDEEEEGEENKIDEQAVEIVSPGKKPKSLEKENEEE